MRYVFDWSILLEHPYLGLLLRGAALTLFLAAVTSVTSFLLGVITAVMRYSGKRRLSSLADLYVEIVRNIPGLYWLLFFYFVFPGLLPAHLGTTLNELACYPIIASLLALTVDNGAYVSDIVLAGLRSIPTGQREAAALTGLSTSQQYRYVLLPQALVKILPPLTVRMVHNFKNTSLCMAISTPELTWATQQIESLTFRGIEVTLVATAFYVGVAMLLGWYAGRLEHKSRATGSARDIRSEALLWDI
jgi:polar amino acid transport system permease protein